MHWVTADLLFNHARALFQFSGDEREINLFDCARGKLFRQSAVGFVVLRDDEATARVLIESMHDTGTFLAADSRELRTMIKERVHQCVLAVPRPGMNDQTGGLVDHDQVVVFEQNIERNRLRLIVDLLQRRLDKIDMIAGADRFARPGWYAIERYRFVADQLLDSRARIGGKLFRQKTIKPKTSVLFRYD